MNYVQTLTQYKAWAGKRFMSVVAKLPDTELKAPRPILFGSLIRTLHHSYAMDYVWQCHLLGKAHGLTTRNPGHCPEFDELLVLQQEVDNWYVRYADSVSADELQDIVEFAFIGGGHGVMSRSDIILHVANHTTYHRGQVADMLYQIGVFPPTTDLPVFLQELAIAR